MALAWSDVVVMAPELSDVPSGAQTEILAMVGREVAVSKWPTQALADEAALWLARHHGTFARPSRNGAGGLTQSATVGNVSKTVKLSQNSVVALEATSYGLNYLRMVRLYCARFSVT